MKKRKVLVDAGPEQILLAANIICRGGLVAFPTETVYGLGADVWNHDAIANIFKVKGRPPHDPLIVHIEREESLEELAEIDDPRIGRLSDAFWPGPLTLVLPRRSGIPDLVTAGLQTIAIRMPDHPVASALIRKTGIPIAAPSANPFGYVSPTTAEHVLEGLGNQVDLILDGGACPLGLESTIISFATGSPTLLRAGSLSVEDVEEVIGPIVHSGVPKSRPHSPGQFDRHYATRTPLHFLPTSGTTPKFVPGETNGLLAFAPPNRLESYAAVEILSPSGDFVEAAQNLFSALRRLDRRGLDRLWAEPCVEIGLGRAIMDRLSRCAVSASAYPSLGKGLSLIRKNS